MAQIIYGYIRVSTKEQNEDRQRIALAEFPVPEENVIMDKLSGKDFNRPQYRKLLRRMRPSRSMDLTTSTSPGWGAITRRS